MPSSAEQESHNLTKISSRLLSAAELIPLDASVHGFHQRKSYFISKDSDFGDQDVVNELGNFNCEIVHTFSRGHHFITRDLAGKAGSR